MGASSVKKGSFQRKRVVFSGTCAGFFSSYFFNIERETDTRLLEQLSDVGRNGIRRLSGLQESTHDQVLILDAKKMD